jgi:hypothetical protein
MNAINEQRFALHVEEFAMAHDLKLNDDIRKVNGLFDKYGRLRNTNSTKSIDDIAQSIGLKQSDQRICGMLLSIWTDIYLI